MSAQTVTIISGVALLVVFLLVRWNLKRRRGHAPNSTKPTEETTQDGSPGAGDGKRE